MIKRMVSIVLVLATIFASQITVFAKENEKANKDDKDEIAAPYAVLCEKNTGEILWSKNAEERTAPASLTKIMTMILVMEQISAGELDWDEELTTSEHANSMGGSQIWLKANEKMTVKDLVKAVMIGSANDAAVVFAEKIGGTEQSFVEKMNQKATELGLSNTLFKNATGLDEEGQYTCARDVAVMGNYLLTFEDILEFSGTWMEYLRDGETQLVNTNRLLKQYSGITGLKTGTTDSAGNCLCATAKRDGLELTAVVMGCKTAADRWDSAKQILDIGFTNYEFYTPKNIDEELLPIKVKFGVADYAQIYCEYPKGAVVGKNSLDPITEQVVLSDSVQAPLMSGSAVGKVIVNQGEKQVLEYPVKLRDNIERRTVFKALEMLCRELFAVESSGY